MSSASEHEQVAHPPAQEAEPYRPPPDFDWLTEVAIPIGIFGLLGSLLYYLIELRAGLAGEGAVGPLRWVVFWFLLATIGIARIRTKYGGAAVAGYYSALLAGAVGMFIWVYTGRSGGLLGAVNEGGRGLALLFNWSVVALVWWAAHVVTREATLEENVEVQLEGGVWSLLTEKWQRPGRQEPPEDVDHAQVRPRHPGRMVLWLSLAALVLFAIGQRVLGDTGSHARTAFWCMSLYVLFALALLALTNLSALRMSVRRRGISLSPAVTPAWIVASSLIVLAIVIFSALLPRTRITGEIGQRIAQLPQWIADARRPGLEKGPAQGLGPEGEQPGGEEQGAAEGEEGEEKGAGDEDENGEGAGQRKAPGPFGGWEVPGEAEGEGSGEGEGGAGEERAQPSERPPPELSGLARLLLWLLLAAAGVAILIFVIAHRRRISQGLRELARVPRYLAAVLARFVARIRAWLARLGSGARIGPENLPDDPFVNIFDRGLADGLAPAQVIAYVYRAFQTYTAHRGYEREADQTALEFLRSLPEHVLLPERAAERLTRAYVLATYSPREVTQVQVGGALDTWRLMKQYMERRGMGNGR